MKLKDIYSQIISLDDYTPSEKVNSLFSALVLKATDPSSEEMLSRKKCGCLQRVCSHAEYEMEKHWAKEIISSNNGIIDFPYYKNYVDLTKLEWNALASCTYHEHHDVLFVGSGPLPMTAIILALNHNVRLKLIDNDPVAVRLSRSVIRMLGLQDMISVAQADGSSFEGYGDFNVIFVAALAGTDAGQKEKIFSRIQKSASEDCHIIARSSWGRRKLLYPPLPRSVYSLFKPILEISPYNEIVNSIVVLKNANRKIGSVSLKASQN